MKDLTAAICDRKGCECLATIDMVVIAPMDSCSDCGKKHLARVSVYLYLCEPCARAAEKPNELLAAEDMELVREVLAEVGYEAPDFSRSLWEYAPVPAEHAIRPN